MKILQQIFRQVLQLISSLKCNIYGIIDPRDSYEFRYVGKTPYLIEKRLEEHIVEAKQEGKNKIKTYKCNWLRKLSKENITPIIVLIDIVPLFQWKYWEKYYIKYYKNLGHRLTNSTEGGEGTLGYKHTKEGRRKAGEANLDKHPSKKTLLKLSKAKSGKNNPMYDKTWVMLEETKKKIGKGNLGKTHVPETIEKMKRIALFSYANGRKRFCGKENVSFDKKHSEESNKKQSKSMTGKMVGEKNPNYGKTWEEMYGIEGAKKMRKERSKASSGKNHPNYGKTWEEIHGPEKADKMRKDARKRRKREVEERLTKATE